MCTVQYRWFKLQPSRKDNGPWMVMKVNTGELQWWICLKECNAMQRSTIKTMNSFHFYVSFWTIYLTHQDQGLNFKRAKMWRKMNLIFSSFLHIFSSLVHSQTMRKSVDAFQYKSSSSMHPKHLKQDQLEKKNRRNAENILTSLNCQLKWRKINTHKKNEKKGDESPIADKEKNTFRTLRFIYPFHHRSSVTIESVSTFVIFCFTNNFSFTRRFWLAR